MKNTTITITETNLIYSEYKGFEQFRKMFDYLDAMPFEVMARMFAEVSDEEINEIKISGVLNKSLIASTNLDENQTISQFLKSTLEKFSIKAENDRVLKNIYHGLRYDLIDNLEYGDLLIDFLELDYKLV